MAHSFRGFSSEFLGPVTFGPVVRLHITVGRTQRTRVLTLWSSGRKRRAGREWDPNIPSRIHPPCSSTAHKFNSKVSSETQGTLLAESPCKKQKESYILLGYNVKHLIPKGRKVGTERRYRNKLKLKPTNVKVSTSFKTFL